MIVGPAKMIIGFLGEAGSGKDTAADHLVAKHGFVKMSLADEMKRICKNVYGFTDEQLWGPSQARNAPDARYHRSVYYQDGIFYDGGFLTPRYALQTLGTEWGRNCYENTWVDLTMRYAHLVLGGRYSYNREKGLIDLYEPGEAFFKGVVIPDCRFENEVDAIRANGGYVVKLIREGRPRLPGEASQHVSEKGQASIPDEKFAFILNVEEGIPVFQQQVDDVLDALGFGVVY